MSSMLEDLKRLLRQLYSNRQKQSSLLLNPPLRQANHRLKRSPACLAVRLILKLEMKVKTKDEKKAEYEPVTIPEPSMARRYT
jgi:hypothetical protein